MPIRVGLSISMMLVGTALTGKWVSATPAHDWVRFAVSLFATILGFHIAASKGEDAMPGNLHLIRLELIQLPLVQLVGLAALLSSAKCNMQLIKPFTPLQIAFGITSAIAATAFTYSHKETCLSRQFDARETAELKKFAEAS